MAIEDENSASQITKQLRDWGEDKNPPPDALISLVYNELHRQAHRYLARERAGHTLQTTALVHEAYLKLNQQKNVVWESRSHFFAIAANLMRRIFRGLRGYICTLTSWTKRVQYWIVA